MLWPKSWGAGIMVSDSVDEKNGYLCLTDKEFKSACDQNIVSKRRLENIWNMEKIKKATGLQPYF